MATAAAALFATSATGAGAGAAAGTAAASGGLLGVGATGAAASAALPALSAVGTGAGAGFLGNLATGLFVASGIGSVIGGLQESATYEAQAKMEEFNAEQELLRGHQESAALLKELNDNLARQTVAAFASGLAPTGSVEVGKQQAVEQAEFQTGLTRTDAQMRAGARRQQADVYRQRGTSAITGGLFEGATTIGLGIERQMRR